MPQISIDSETWRHDEQYKILRADTVTLIEINTTNNNPVSSRNANGITYNEMEKGFAAYRQRFEGKQEQSQPIVLLQ